MPKINPAPSSKAPDTFKLTKAQRKKFEHQMLMECGNKFRLEVDKAQNQVSKLRKILSDMWLYSQCFEPLEPTQTTTKPEEKK